MARSIFLIVFLIATRAIASLQDDVKIELNVVKVLSPQSCDEKLAPLERSLSEVDFGRYDNEMLTANSLEIRNLYWQLRLRLHKQLAQMTPECVLKAREIFHSLRDLDDYLSEFSDHAPALQSKGMDFQKEPVPIYDVQAYPGTKSVSENFQFQDGDLMLARGFSFFSAMISQISDNVDHFSHTIIVSVKGNDVRTTESYVGDGMYGSSF